MSFLRNRPPTLPRGVRRLFGFPASQTRLIRDADEEMRFHLEMWKAEFRAQGMSETEAAMAAERRFGNPDEYRRYSSNRATRRALWHRVDEVRSDVRYAVRRLVNRPAYAGAIVLVMGLGLGATTAMFSAVDAVMLRALPFPEPDRLVLLPQVEVPFPGRGEDRMVELPEVAAMPELFTSAAAFASGRLNLRDESRPLRLRVGVVTVGFFRTLGVAPAAGRVFVAEEGVPDGPAVVILSHALWQREYGGRDMLGQTILLNDERHEVIGIMPRGFSFPQESDLWIPMSVPNTRRTLAAFRGYVPSRVLARLARGVDVAVANRQLVSRWEQTIVTREPGIREDILTELRSAGAVRPLQSSLSGQRARPLVLLLGATVLLLLIACVNVTHLLLSDAATRTREVLIRTALGASRGRVARQVLIESVVLALGGIIAALVLAPLLLRTLQVLLPAGLAGLSVTRIDGRVLGFASALGLLTGIGFGLWPARTATRADPAEALKSGGSQHATRRNGTLGRRTLITVELALTVMLLVGSGLLLRSFANLMRVERGMDTARVGSVEMSMVSSMPRAARLARIAEILERLRRTPGIEHAAIVNDLPLGSEWASLQLLAPVEGAAALPMQRRGARYLQVSPGYFATLGIRLRGRDFTAHDDSLAPPTIIINEALARRWFPGADPLGRQLRASGIETPYTIIGVVADVREQGLRAEAMPQLYHPVSRLTPNAFALLARGRAEPGAILGALRNAVRAVDPGQALSQARMMDQVVRDSVAPQRTNTLLITLFAALALVLATVGVYSVVAQGVAQRGREFGIRSALGATAGDLLGMVSREVLVLVAIGIAIGLAGAWAGSRVLESMVYGVTTRDPATFAIGPAVLGVVAMTAAVLPLRRVFRLDPRDVMRSE